MKRFLLADGFPALLSFIILAIYGLADVFPVTTNFLFFVLETALVLGLVTGATELLETCFVSSTLAIGFVGGGYLYIVHNMGINRIPSAHFNNFIFFYLFVVVVCHLIARWAIVYAFGKTIKPLSEHECL